VISAPIIRTQLLEDRVFREQVAQLCQIRAWRWVVAVALDWFVIAVAVAAAIHIQHVVSSAVTIAIVASRQHSLGTLLHEAVHYRAFRSKSVNDIMADVLVAFPLGLSTSGFRIFHFRHHAHLGTSRDPEAAAALVDPSYTWPKTRWGAMRILLLDLVGVNARSQIRYLFYFSLLPRLLRLTPARATQWLGVPPHAASILYDFSREPARLSVRELVAWTASMGLYACVLTMTQMWWALALYWIVPWLTVFVFISRLRMASEHGGLASSDPVQGARTITRPSLLARWFVCPDAVHYHIEHHMFPHVPYYNLEKLHDLMISKSDFGRQANVHASYTQSILAAVVK